MVTKQPALLIFSAWLGIFAAFGFGFHLSYQVIVLHLEAILAIVGLAMLGLEAALLAAVGSLVARTALERLGLLLGCAATMAALAVVGFLHASLNVTAFPDQDLPTSMLA
ncbi:unnamed protein product [Effrenium voratum]|uniref:Uncharacterized protein n=1 Tax=Effrenium voratum TaxID=2562239 RepID=A0AA36J0S3_9DINO|nr:unnamed protein product [Effrenium voratum]